MDTETLRSTGAAADANKPKKPSDILLALESGELTFVEAMRGAVDKMQTDAALPKPKC